MIVGQMFHTLFESGCVVKTTPDRDGNFSALDSDGVRCEFNLNMVCVCTKLHSEGN